MNPAYRGIPPFAMFTRFTPALPQFYTGVPTMEQGFKELCKNFHKMVCYVDNMADVQNLTSEEVAQLQADFKQFQESGFEDYYAQQIEAWVNANVANIFEQYAKLVLFGLDDEGHFVAYVPDSWSEIWFDTIADYQDPNYGCLVLCWDGDGQNVDPQGPSSNRISYEQLLYKPKINGVELTGDKSFPDLGLTPITTQQVDDAFGGV